MRATWCIWVALICSACGSTPAGGDDAGREAEADAGVRLDAGGGVDASMLTAREDCEAVVDAYVAASSAEGCDSRVCRYGVARGGCAGSHAPVVQAMFECLAADPCQVPSDPSGASGCVGALSGAASGLYAELGREFCRCSGTEPGCPTFPGYTGPELLLVPEDEIAPMLECVRAAACDAVSACLYESEYMTAVLECSS